MTINACGDRATLDICKLESNSIIIPSEFGWKHPRATLKNKEYEGELLVTAQNAKPLRLSIKLKPKSKYVDIEYHEISETL